MMKGPIPGCSSTPCAPPPPCLRHITDHHHTVQATLLIILLSRLTLSLHASTSAKAPSRTSGSDINTSWNISNSCVGSMTALASRLLSTNARARSKVSCASMLAYKKLLSKGSAAASRSASRLQVQHSRHNGREHAGEMVAELQDRPYSQRVWWMRRRLTEHKRVLQAAQINPAGMIASVGASITQVTWQATNFCLGSSNAGLVHARHKKQVHTPAHHVAELKLKLKRT